MQMARCTPQKLSIRIPNLPIIVARAPGQQPSELKSTPAVDIECSRRFQHLCSK